MSQLAEFAPDVDLTQEEADPEEQQGQEAGADQPEEKEPEQAEKPEEEAPPKKPDEPPKMVPLAALHESRIKEREARQRAEALQRDSEERFRRLEERLKVLQTPPVQPPKFEEDPANHLRHQVESIRSELEPVRASLKDREQRENVARAEQDLTMRVNAAEAEFIAQQPDYLEAVRHIQSAADRNLQMMGVEDPAQRAQAIRNDALALSARAFQMGKNPAELIYALAQNQGYTVKKTESPEQKKLETIAKGQKSGGSMPSGGAKESALTLSALEQMDDDEFNKLIADEKSWNKIIRQ